MPAGEPAGAGRMRSWKRGGDAGGGRGGQLPFFSKWTRAIILLAVLENRSFSRLKKCC